MNLNSLTTLLSAMSAQDGTTPEQRKAYVELTLAKHIAWALPLPSQPVSGLDQYFGESFADTVSRIVSDLNEEFPINTVSTRQLAFNLYKARYQMVHDAASLGCDQLQALLDSDSARRALSASYRSAATLNYIVAEPYLSRFVNGRVQGV